MSTTTRQEASILLKSMSQEQRNIVAEALQGKGYYRPYHVIFNGKLELFDFYSYEVDYSHADDVFMDAFFAHIDQQGSTHIMNTMVWPSFRRAFILIRPEYEDDIKDILATTK